MFSPQFLLSSLLVPYQDPIKCSFLASLFEKNSACFKKSLFLPLNLPTLREIHSLLLFYSENKQPACPKHFLQTNATIIVWFLTAFEFAVGRDFKQMVVFCTEFLFYISDNYQAKKDWIIFSVFFSNVDIFKLQLQLYTHLTPESINNTWDSRDNAILFESLR